MTKTERNKHIYYLAISGMQKCIRRGLTDLAIEMYRTACKIDAYGVRSRILITMYEDVGDADLSTLNECIKLCYRNGECIVSHKERYIWEDVIRLLSNARVKTRDICLYFEDVFSDKVERYKNTPPKYFDGGIQGIIKNGVQIENRLAVYCYYLWTIEKKEDIIKECINLVNEKSDINHINFIIALTKANLSDDLMYSIMPFLVFKRKFTGIVTNTVSYIMIGDFPSFAYDVHTSLGKTSLQILAKQMNKDYEKVGNYVFYNEGDVINNLAVYDTNVKSMVMNYYMKHNAFDKIDFNKLNEIRQQVYNKYFVDIYLIY